MKHTLLVTCILVFLKNGYSDTLTSLTCEYRSNPFGIDVPQPRLGWVFSSQTRGQKQTAYQIMVGATPAGADAGDMWNSGKVTGGQSVHVPYAGSTLLSGKRYYWKVRIWDKDDVQSSWSQTALWCMGKLAPGDWQGQWIGSGLLETSVNLRKETSISKAIKQATAFMSGLGYSELYIQGKKVGPAVMGPGFTTFTKRVYYVTEDVTSYLTTGVNAIGVILGNGFYNTPAGGYVNWSVYPWRDAPKLLLDIEIEFTDGSMQTISSDETWKWSTNEITHNSIWDGENIDGRLVKTGWDTAGYDDASWSQTVPEEAPAGVLCARQTPPLTVTKSAPVSVAGNTFTFDAISSGWVRVKASGTSGQALTISGAFPSSIILAGNGEEEHAARFCFHTISKQVTVTGLTAPVDTGTVTREAMHMNLQRTGDFCSDPFLNSLHEIDIRTQLNYTNDVPVDPTREKDGWTQDAENMLETNACLFDALTLYRKWWIDMLDVQNPDGSEPEISPGPVVYGDQMNSPWWGGMIVWVPSRLYDYYGDLRFLEEGYDAMKAYVDFLDTKAGPGHQIDWFGLGDWGAIGGSGDINTMGFYSHAKDLARAAALLGKTTDATTYAALAENIRAVFTESSYSSPVALCLGITPPEQRAKAQQALVAGLKSNDYHVGTGFVATKFLLQALIDADDACGLYKMTTQQDYPGWKSVQVDGVFGEFWNGGPQMPAAAGCIGLYLYQGLGGIRPDSTGPGFKKFIVSPLACPELSFVNCSYVSPYGPIVSNWTVSGLDLTMDVTVPANTQAQVRVLTGNSASVQEGGHPADSVPGVAFVKHERNRAVYTVQPGVYHFTANLGGILDSVQWNGRDSNATAFNRFGDITTYIMLPRNGMSARATSEHPASTAGMAVDGDTATIWHTNFPGVSLPQSITLVLNSLQQFDGLFYYPRHDGSTNGEVTRYQISVSMNDTDYASVATGVWLSDRKARMARFPETTAKYVRLEVIEGVGGFGTAAEIALGVVDSSYMRSGPRKDKSAIPELSASPNPFNPSVSIHYSISSDVSAEYRIFNLSGQTLFSTALKGGQGALVWDGHDRRGNALASGCYLGSLETNDGKRLMHKLLLMR